MADSYGVIQQYLKKYQTAKSFNSKEIRLTLNEAEELNLSLTFLLAEHSSLQSKILELQTKLLENNQNDIQLTGGNF